MIATTSDTILAVGTALAAIIAAVFAGLANLKAGAAHKEMQTGNGKTLGQTVTEIKKTVNGGGTS